MLKIPPSIGDGHDFHLGFQNTECDCNAALEPNRAKTGQNVVATRSALRVGGKRNARFLDAVDVAAGNLVARLLRDAFVETDEVSLGFRAENDLKRHVWRLSHSLRDGLAGA